MKKTVFRSYLISITFVCTIFLPCVSDSFGLFKDVPNLENRKLSKKPAIDINSLDGYPAAFERYYNDTFMVRNRMTHAFNFFKCAVLKTSPFPDKVVVGKHGWLYMGGADLDVYLGKNRLSTTELITLKNEFEKRSAYLRSKNCELYLVITPGKATVYPENLPSNLIPLNKQGWGEELIAYLDKNSSVKTVDLFKGFRTVRSEYPLYYTIDNHWNKIGAFHAANIIIHELKKERPELRPLDLKGFKIIEKPRSIGNMKQMLGNLDMYKDTDYELLPVSGFKAHEVPKENYPPPAYFAYPWDYEIEKEIKNSDQPRLLIFSDSFGGYPFPFLCENFSRTVKIFGGWDYVMNKEIIEKEKPDIVLLMVHESLIRNILDHLSG